MHTLKITDDELEMLTRIVGNHIVGCTISQRLFNELVLLYGEDKDIDPYTGPPDHVPIIYGDRPMIWVEDKVKKNEPA